MTDGPAVPTSRREFARLLAMGPAALLAARHALPAAWPLPLKAEAPDERFWVAVREQFLFPREVAHLNAANLCPSPRPVVEAVFNAADLDHDLSPRNRERMHAAKEIARAALAEFLRASPDEILITRNTSESNNLVSSGLDLKAGDEVIVFADNHASNREAWQLKARRFGYTVVTVGVIRPHPGPEGYLEAFAARLTARTRVVAFTHLTNTVGDLFPARELCRMARERGALTLVDGAQSFGLMDVDLSNMQPDFYSGSAHKWPCGPKETGVLYVRKEVQARLWPTIVSLYPGVAGVSKRVEAIGQRDEPAFLGLAEAVRFQTGLGRSAIEERARQLARALVEGLKRMDGVELYTHPDPVRSHAILSFRPGTLDPKKLADALYDEHRVVAAVRSGLDRPGLRFSPHFYNGLAEVETTLAALRGYLRKGL